MLQFGTSMLYLCDITLQCLGKKCGSVEYIALFSIFIVYLRLRMNRETHRT